MDLTKDLLSRLLDAEKRLGKLESANQVQKIATKNGTVHWARFAPSLETSWSAAKLSPRWEAIAMR